MKISTNEPNFQSNQKRDMKKYAIKIQVYISIATEIYWDRRYNISGIYWIALDSVYRNYILYYCIIRMVPFLILDQSSTYISNVLKSIQSIVRVEVILLAFWVLMID